MSKKLSLAILFLSLLSGRVFAEEGSFDKKVVCNVDGGDFTSEKRLTVNSKKAKSSAIELDSRDTIRFSISFEGEMLNLDVFLANKTKVSTQGFGGTVTLGINDKNLTCYFYEPEEL